MQIIAEVKTHSPFGWGSEYSWDELFELANNAGDMISIHTDPRWHGSFGLLRKARRLTRKPILAKGIHARDDDIAQALDAGADWVLVVGRTPGVHADKCLIEPSSLEQLRLITPNTKAVWNSRDLLTGGLKPETFSQARASFPGWLCQASNIRTWADVDQRAEAVLVGSYLKAFIQSK